MGAFANCGALVTIPYLALHTLGLTAAQTSTSQRVRGRRELKQTLRQHGWLGCVVLHVGQSIFVLETTTSASARANKQRMRSLLIINIYYIA